MCSPEPKCHLSVDTDAAERRFRRQLMGGALCECATEEILRFGIGPLAHPLPQRCRY
uniref:Uncharacterized protein n=1 Tax=Anopheles arabiensis TaxID=7173 RepID=A0A8W7MTL4_ANOAR